MPLSAKLGPFDSCLRQLCGTSFSPLTKNAKRPSDRRTQKSEMKIMAPCTIFLYLLLHRPLRSDKQHKNVAEQAKGPFHHSGHNEAEIKASSLQSSDPHFILLLLPSFSVIKSSLFGFVFHAHSTNLWTHERRNAICDMWWRSLKLCPAVLVHFAIKKLSKYTENTTHAAHCESFLPSVKVH